MPVFEEEDIHFINNALPPPELPKDLKTSQRTDGDLIKVIKRLKRHLVAPDDSLQKFTLVDGILCRSTETPTGPKLAICVPRCLVYETLTNLHEDVTAGHLGITKTIAKAKERYWWKGMRADVQELVSSCRDFQSKKFENLPRAGLLQPIKVGGPFEMMGMEILGPFPSSVKGNKHIVVAADYLTHWAECLAVPRANAEACATFIAGNIVCKFGAPRVILTDRAKCFESQLIEQIYALFTVKHSRTTAHHSATNGLAERFNKTLATMLAMYVCTNHTDWDRAIPFVTFGYNTSIQASTRFTPFYLTHG